ncbi:MAG: AAA family ATPase [Methanosarcinales archaeon]|nr:AAA family ATPase [Methanosarcinales archaeon]
MTPKTIVRLQASNVMNIDAIVVEANGNNVTLTGKNGAGKSAFLKAIEFALSGKALAATPEPVRHGQKSGDILLDLGDIIVKRHFTNESSTVKIENKDGAVFKSPQALLDKFRGNIAFDPMSFAGLPEKQQKEVLLGMIDLPIDLDELDLKRKGIYDNRTDVNRDIKRLEGQRDGIPDMPDVPDEEESAVDVMADMQAATEQITDNNNKRTDLSYQIEGRATTATQLSYLNDEIIRLQDEAESYKLKLATEDHTIADMKVTVESLMDPDLEQFKCKLEDVEQINVQVRQKQDRTRITTQINDLKATSLGMTVDMTAIDELKTKTISDAGMPVIGLGFNESGVTFGNVPLSQCSDGQKRLISARIGMAMNPDLRVLWVPDASLLDTDSINDLKDMADENGYQLWLECVSDDETVGVHIEAKDV